MTISAGYQTSSALQNRNVRASLTVFFDLEAQNRQIFGVLASSGLFQRRGGFQFQRNRYGRPARPSLLQPLRGLELRQEA